jgi:hypothetical protein
LWVRAFSPDITSNSAPSSKYLGSPHPSRMFLRERAEILSSSSTGHGTRITLHLSGRTTKPVRCRDLSPLPLTLAKTAGVCPHSSHSGSPRASTLPISPIDRFATFLHLYFQRLNMLLFLQPLPFQAFALLPGGSGVTNRKSGDQPSAGTPTLSFRHSYLLHSRALANAQFANSFFSDHYKLPGGCTPLDSRLFLELTIRGEEANGVNPPLRAIP